MNMIKMSRKKSQYFISNSKTFCCLFEIKFLSYSNKATNLVTTKSTRKHAIPFLKGLGMLIPNPRKNG